MPGGSTTAWTSVYNHGVHEGATKDTETFFNHGVHGGHGGFLDAEGGLTFCKGASRGVAPRRPLKVYIASDEAIEYLSNLKFLVIINISGYNKQLGSLRGEAP